MPKRPVISGSDMIRILERIGYVAVRQKGSHVRMRHPIEAHRLPTTIPLHRELKPGTLNAILRDAGLIFDDLEQLR